MRKIIRYIPRYFYVCGALALISAVLTAAFHMSAPFADFFNGTVSSFFRSIVASVTNHVNFSIAEGLLLFSPVLAVAAAMYIVRKYDKGVYIRLFSLVLSVVFAAFSSFTLMFSSGYRGTSLAEKLGMERCDVTAEELAATLLILKDKVNEYASRVKFDDDGFSVMPYDTDGLSAALYSAYNEVCGEYDFIGAAHGRLKPIMLSEPMTYTHISGVYTFVTGEANLNINYPDYVVAYSGAHELAHQRGIAREDEANFVAYLVCAAAEDDYLRYSGYLSLYRYVASALSSADRELYAETADGLDRRVIGEMRAYSVFFDKYRENTVADVSDKMNDAYLTMQGTAGSRSYGMVVDLAVAYFAGNEPGRR